MSAIRHQHAAGEIIPRHRHGAHQLIYVARGILAIDTAHGAWVASADRAVWIPAFTWHEHRAYGETTVHTLTFPIRDTPFPGRTPTIVAAQGLMRELVIASTDPSLPADEGRHIRTVLRDRLRRADIRALTLPAAHDPRLVDVCRLVTEDLSRPRSIGWLAREVGASERTLARLFRTEFGTTYPQWRTSIRMFHAMIHLAEGATVTETGRRCGWATTSAFVDTFARSMGQTPGAYATAALAQ